jgi:hypothetical protein
MPEDLRIEADKVREVASEVSSIATSFDEMKSYATLSQLGSGHFGNVQGLSQSAGAYPEKSLELAESLGRAATFLKDYATRLNKSASLTEGNDLESAWTVTTKGEGV